MLIKYKLLIHLVEKIPRVKEEDRERNRKLLLKVGKELFMQFGIKKTTIGDLTTRSHLSKGAFYSYFESKEELFLAIFVDLNDQLTEKMTNFFSNSDLPPKQRLLEMSKLRYQTFNSNPFYQFIFDQKNENELDLILLKLPHAKEILENAKDIKHSYNFVAMLQKNSIIRSDINHQLVANLLHTLFVVFLNKKEFDPTYFQQTFDIFQELLIDYIV